mmetsp:Transcript_26841/g.46808  ORF Transcript_26841/g.46808 Transcript_26841/m.46808 type:complete len:247 (-) Transcript_26841:418-1158(-)
MDSLEDIPLVLEFTRTDFIENLQHDEDVEDQGVVAGGGGPRPPPPGGGGGGGGGPPPPPPPPPRGGGPGPPPPRHYTLVFHIFVMLQVFNEISSRKLQNEWNVFEGIHKNPLFLGIVIGTVIVQIIVVMYGGTAVTVTPLNATEHIVSIIFGLGGMAVTMLMRLVPETLFPEMAGSGKLVTDKERQIWSAFTRRNSNPFVLSQRGKVGAGSIGSMKSPKKRPCLLEAIEEHAKWEEGQGVEKGEVV